MPPSQDYRPLQGSVICQYVATDSSGKPKKLRMNSFSAACLLQSSQAVVRAKLRFYA